MKTSELTGAPLDWAVAKAIGEYKPVAVPNYSTDWTQSGPIIERERIAITPFTVTVGDDKGKREWFSNYENAAPHENAYMSGDTPLVAAMRCLVASKLGDTIDVPEALK